MHRVKPHSLKEMFDYMKAEDDAVKKAQRG